MGLRGTANKRKIGEGDVASPKLVRTDEWDSEIQYSPAAATAVAVATPTPTPTPTPIGRSYHSYNNNNNSSSSNSSNVSPLAAVNVNVNVNGASASDEYEYHTHTHTHSHSHNHSHSHSHSHRSCYQVQQTIRCDENGKSYLDLGSWNSATNVNRCCEARTSWCSRGPSCYRQKRLAVLNISMCKLGRYRQFSDPSLHRSVLICNTLRLIEKEMEQEGYFNSPPPPCSPSASANANASQSQSSVQPATAAEPLALHQQFSEVPVPYEPPRVPTPFPAAVTDSDDEKSINWGSVLSLSSQSDLDPLNNNDCLGDSDLSLSHDLDDFIPSWKMSEDSLRPVAVATSCAVTTSDNGELDNIMHVLVGT